jgi:hypothetical protein
MKSNTNPDYVREFVQALLMAAKVIPRLSPVCLELEESSDKELREEDSLPIPVGALLLCQATAATKDEAMLRALGEAIRLAFHLELTDAHLKSLFQVAADRPMIIEAREMKVPLLIYPSGIVWAPATHFCANFCGGVWNVQAAGHPVESRKTLREIITLIAFYNRQGYRPAGRE